MSSVKVRRGRFRTSLGEKEGRKLFEFVAFRQLPGQDSNLDKESQNLLCYRYTTGYFSGLSDPYCLLI